MKPQDCVQNPQWTQKEIRTAKLLRKEAKNRIGSTAHVFVICDTLKKEGPANWNKDQNTDQVEKK